MTRHHKKGEDSERNIRVNRGIYALAICIVPDRLVPTMRISLDEMHGDDWVAIPYSLARSLHDTLSVYIRQKLPYLVKAKQSLIYFDQDKGVLGMTAIGTAALQKLGDKIGTR